MRCCHDDVVVVVGRRVLLYPFAHECYRDDNSSSLVRANDIPVAIVKQLRALFLFCFVFVLEPPMGCILLGSPAETAAAAAYLTYFPSANIYALYNVRNNKSHHFPTRWARLLFPRHDRAGALLWNSGWLRASKRLSRPCCCPYYSKIDLSLSSTRRATPPCC